MGLISKTLSPPSSYASKKTDQWSELKDRIDAALLPADLDAFEAWLDAYPLEYPAAYREPLDELIETRREELRAEDIGEIVRTKWDFS